MGGIGWVILDGGRSECVCQDCRVRTEGDDGASGGKAAVMYRRVCVWRLWKQGEMNDED